MRTPSQETVVNRLFVTNGVCSKEQLYAEFYLSTESHKPDSKIVRENIRVIRKRLRSHGIEIKTVFGKGYAMPCKSKSKLRKLVAPRGSQVQL